MKVVRPWKRTGDHSKHSRYWKYKRFLGMTCGQNGFVRMVLKPMCRYPDWLFWDYEKDVL